MKKKVIIIFIVIAVIVSIFKFYPFSNKTYTSNNSNLSFEVPGMTIFKEECCMFSVSFTSFRSKKSLEKSMNDILSKYEKIIDYDKTYYIDKNKKVIISQWGVESKLLYNTLYIVYDKYFEKSVEELPKEKE